MGSDNKPQISVWRDSAALTEAAARRIVLIAQQAITERGQFVWALSGGATPRPLYELLGSKTVNVTIEDPNEGKVYQRELPLSSRGTFSGASMPSDPLSS